MHLWGRYGARQSVLLHNSVLMAHKQGFRLVENELSVAAHHNRICGCDIDLFCREENYANGMKKIVQ